MSRSIARFVERLLLASEEPPAPCDHPDRTAFPSGKNGRNTRLLGQFR
jgi:hypothetical protein